VNKAEHVSNVSGTVAAQTLKALEQAQKTRQSRLQSTQSNSC